MKNKFKFCKDKFSLFLSILFLFQLVLFSANDTAFATTTTSVSYTVTGEAKVGNTIEIAVNISNVKDLYGGSIDFIYDTSLLQIQSVTKGNIFGSNEVLTPLGNNGKIENGQASFSILMKGNKTGVSTNGSLAIIKAKVLKEGTVKLNTTSSNTALDLNSNTIRVKLSNSKAENITYNSSNKTISLLTANTALNPGTYQENNSDLIYSGSWYTRSSSNYDSGALKLSNSTNSSVEFSFNGTSFEWYGTKAFNRGIAKVYIDEKEVKSVDAYSSSNAFKQLLFKSDNLKPGIHTVKIVVTGLKNDASSDSLIDLDKIIIKNEVNILSPGTYQENDSSLLYNGSWYTRSSSNYDSGALKLSNSTNSSVEFSFNGTSFEWYGTKAFNRGIAKVYIDEKEVESVDAYSSSNSFKQLLFKSAILDSGIHTVKIVVTGLKNDASSDSLIDLDKIIIKNEVNVLSPGTYQENDSNLLYTGSWYTRSSSNYDSGALKLSNSTNSSVEFNFNGTSFEWYGSKAFNRGIAKVYIDGKEVKSVDAYSSSNAFKQLLFKSDNLTPGIHTVKIVATGSKNQDSSNSQIDLDKIVIK